jgi:hypothetical protein
MFGSILQWDELSMTTAPFLAASGARASLTDPPAENSAMSTPLKASGSAKVTGTWTPLYSMVSTNDLLDAKRLKFLMGKFLYFNTVSIYIPTFLIVPNTATLNSLSK